MHCKLFIYLFSFFYFNVTISTLNIGMPELLMIHYENTPIQIYRNFHLQKPENFQIKNSDIFHISAQNIDCGYLLEPPHKAQFYNIKVGFKGVKII